MSEELPPPVFEDDDDLPDLPDNPDDEDDLPDVPPAGLPELSDLLGELYIYI